MGIDIYAYKKVEKIECTFNADGEPINPETGDLFEWEDKIVRPCVNPDFPGRADEIEERVVYQYQECDHFFSAGYGRYGAMRNELGKLAGYPLEEYERWGMKQESHCVACWNGEIGPFSEIINFSDCEGTIGAKVSQKLFKDFVKLQDKADAHSNEFFITFYNGLRGAFEMASDGGIVRFT